jgi:L-arabinokinase
VDERRLSAAGLRYEDVVAAADIVITKPGYGIISESIANDTAILYTSRGHFVEYDVLVREMPRWVRCGFISNEDLIAGNWQRALDDLCAQPAPPERADVAGAERAADLIAERY